MMTDRSPFREDLLAGRAALVTGGGQGIGRATARALLEAGASVLIAEVDQEAGQEVAAELSVVGDVVFEPCDVTRQADVKAAVEAALGRWGRLDILVNNVGIARGGPVTALTLEDFNHVLAANLTSIYLFAHHAAEALGRNGGGAMVNIASTRALMSEPHTEAYSASKGGVVALTHSLAVSLGPAVRVNCISPGWIETAQWKKSAAQRPIDHSDADRSQHPAGRVGEPMDIARMAVYLASDAAGFITGQNIIIDGGMTRKMIYV